MSFGTPDRDEASLRYQMSVIHQASGYGFSITGGGPPDMTNVTEAEVDQVFADILALINSSTDFEAPDYGGPLITKTWSESSGYEPEEPEE